MKQELSGFDTIQIQAKFHDGYRTTNNLYFWITQKGARSNAGHVIVFPVSSWHEMSELATLSLQEFGL
jgi:hypothetical protein